MAQDKTIRRVALMLREISYLAGFSSGSDLRFRLYTNGIFLEMIWFHPEKNAAYPWKREYF